MANMQSTRWTLLAIVAAMAIMTGCKAPSKGLVDLEAERQAVLAVNQQFMDALNAMFKGDAAPFADVWWHWDDAVYMGADKTYDIGWQAIESNWQKQAKLNLGGHVKLSEVTVAMTDNAAVVNKLVTGHNIINGQEREVHLRSTSVLFKQQGQWKFISHHVDPIPGLHVE